MLRPLANQNNNRNSERFLSPRNMEANQGKEIEMLFAEDNNEGFKLAEIWKALKRRRKIVFLTATLIIITSFSQSVIKLIRSPVYKGSFQLLIDDPIKANKSGGANEASKTTLFKDLVRGDVSQDLPTLIALLKSPAVLGPISKPFNMSPQMLAYKISIEPGQALNSDRKQIAKGILNISIRGKNKAENLKLLEAISEGYLNAAQEQRQQRLTTGIEFMNKQAPELEAKTNNIQKQLEIFRRTHNLLEPKAQGVAMKQEELRAETSILDLQSYRKRLLQIKKDIALGNVSAKNFQSVISSGSTSGNEVIAVSEPDAIMLDQLVEIEKELAKARSRYTPTSIRVKSLEARLAKLKPLFKEDQLNTIDLALKLNAQRIETEKEQLASINSKFLKQPPLIKEYENLELKLEVAKKNLQGLIDARESFRFEMAQRSIPWRIISPPMSDDRPIEPNLQEELISSIMLGIVIGLATGLTRDRFDHVFHSSKEVREELDLPLLGHIPHVELFKGVRENKRFLLQDLDKPISGNDTDEVKRKRFQRFFYQEAFRNLYTSIRFLNSDKPLRAITLTSSLPSEGKSLVNVLLAKTLSEMGQKILLIDADLRKPQLHTRLGLNNLTGLSNLLTESNINWRKVLNEVPDHENWKIMTAGTKPPDPTRLLSSKRMNDLVKELSTSGEFDIILFDTPPVLGLADAALVAEHCDGLLLLVSLDRVDRSLPRESVNRIRSSGAPLLGIVTNAIKVDRQSTLDDSATYDTYAHYADDDETIVSQPTTEEDNDDETLNNRKAKLVAQFKKLRDQSEKLGLSFTRWLDS